MCPQWQKCALNHPTTLTQASRNGMELTLREMRLTWQGREQGWKERERDRESMCKREQREQTDLERQAGMQWRRHRTQQDRERRGRETDRE